MSEPSINDLTPEQEIVQERRKEISPGRPKRGMVVNYRRRTGPTSVALERVGKEDWPYAIMDEDIGMAFGTSVGLANNKEDAHRFAAAKDMQDAIRAFLYSKSDEGEFGKMRGLMRALEKSEGG